MPLGCIIVIKPALLECPIGLRIRVAIRQRILPCTQRCNNNASRHSMGLFVTFYETTRSLEGYEILHTMQAAAVQRKTKTSVPCTTLQTALYSTTGYQCAKTIHALCSIFCIIHYSYSSYIVHVDIIVIGPWSTHLCPRRLLCASGPTQQSSR